jgi:hypothetical protein
VYDGSLITMRRRRVPAFAISATLHVAALVAAIWLEGRSPLELTAAPADAAREPVVVLVESLPPPASPDNDRLAQSLGIAIDDDAASVSLPGFTFNFSKVVGRAKGLFPFLTGTPLLERVTAPARDDSPTRLPNPLAQAPSDQHRPPLQIGDTALQSVIDKAWSRRDRWRLFSPVAVLADRHSADQGRLPALLGAYVDQNGLQPYIDTSIRDPRLWVELGLAADHADFIDFVSRFAIRNPSTRATTELMFLLDKLAQGSLDALTTLVDTDPAADLRWTRGASRDAFDAIVTIRTHYRELLARRKLLSAEALRAYYDGVRIAVLQSILLTTPNGYRAGDARFLIGSIYWKQGKIASARRSWKDIEADPDDHYAAASTEIAAAMRAAEERGIDHRRINRILEYEHGRWVSFSFDRLWQFGYRFDSF